MFNFKFKRRRMGMGILAYGFFCAAVVGVFLWVEDFLWNGMPGRIFISIVLIARWTVLFLMGMPFVAFFYKRQIDQEKLACTDDITGLCNHRQLLDALDRELARARRYDQKLSVMMIDIDNFKSVNDSYGHLVGDQVLQEIGSLLAKGTREVDIVGRYGGDEFLILLPHTGYEEAQRLAWRLEMNVRRHPFKIEKEIGPVSISLGISSFQDLGEKAEGSDLIHRADQAMFNAKNLKHLSQEKVLVA